MTKTFCAVAAVIVLAAGASTAQTAPVPSNEWPDPNFFIQDSSGLAPALNDELTAPLPPIAVTGYTTGARDVTVRVASTQGLDVGQYLSFAAPCDPALRATLLQVKSIAPGRSFDVTLEYPSGVPGASAACQASVIQHGDVSARVGGGAVTSNVQRYAEGQRWPLFWISSRPDHLRRLNGGAHVLVVRKVTDHPEYIFWMAHDLPMVTGGSRAVGAAVSVVSGAGAAARAYINTGAILQGDTVATGPGRTWISAHAEVPPTAPIFQEGVLLTGPAGSTFVLGEFESAPYPTALPDHSFSTPHPQTIAALASISPYAGLSFTMPKDGRFDVNLGQASNLAIAGGVTLMIGNLEGEATSFPLVLSTASPPPRRFSVPRCIRCSIPRAIPATPATTPSPRATGRCGTTAS